jgi:hypothetical protein
MDAEAGFNRHADDPITFGSRSLLTSSFAIEHSV